MEASREQEGDQYDGHHDSQEHEDPAPDVALLFLRNLRMLDLLQRAIGALGHVAYVQLQVP